MRKNVKFALQAVGFEDLIAALAVTNNVHRNVVRVPVEDAVVRITLRMIKSGGAINIDVCSPSCPTQMDQSHVPEGCSEREWLMILALFLENFLLSENSFWVSEPAFENEPWANGMHTGITLHLNRR